jgi:hypothetical protein
MGGSKFNSNAKWKHKNIKETTIAAGETQSTGIKDINSIPATAKSAVDNNFKKAIGAKKYGWK